MYTKFGLILHILYERVGQGEKEERKMQSYWMLAYVQFYVAHTLPTFPGLSHLCSFFSFSFPYYVLLPWHRLSTQFSLFQMFLLNVLTWLTQNHPLDHNWIINDLFLEKPSLTEQDLYYRLWNQVPLFQNDHYSCNFIFICAFWLLSDSPLDWINNS